MSRIETLKNIKKTEAKNNQQTKKALKALLCKMELLPIKSNLSKGVNYDAKPG